MNPNLLDTNGNGIVGTVIHCNPSASSLITSPLAAGQVLVQSEGNDTATATLTAEYYPPESCTLTATPDTISAGGDAALSWTLTNTRGTFDPQYFDTALVTSDIPGGILDSTEAVSPAATATYGIDVDGDGTNDCETT
jgi:hypothetical protein